MSITSTGEASRLRTMQAEPEPSFEYLIELGRRRDRTRILACIDALHLNSLLVPSDSSVALLQGDFGAILKSEYGNIFKLLKYFSSIDTAAGCLALCLEAIDRLQIHHMLPDDFTWCNPDTLPPQIIRARAPAYSEHAPANVVSAMRSFIATGQLPRGDASWQAELYLFAKEIKAGSYIYMIEAFAYFWNSIEYGDKDAHIRVLRVAQGDFREKLKSRLLRVACQTFEANPAAAKELVNQMRSVDPKIFATLKLYDLLSEKVRKDNDYATRPVFDGTMLTPLKELLPEVEEIDTRYTLVSPEIIEKMGDYFPSLHTLTLVDARPALIRLQACSKMKLRHLTLYPECDISLTEFLQKTPPPFFATLESCYINPRFWTPRRIILLVPHLRSVTALTLEGEEELDNECLTAIATHIPHLQSFTANLSNWVSEKNLKDFCAHYPNMKEITLKSQHAATAVLECSSLETITLNCYFKDETAIQCIEKHPRIKKLCIHHSGITDAALPALTRLKELQVLDILGTYTLSDDSICELVTQLPALQSLTITRICEDTRMLKYLPQRGIETKIIRARH